MNDRELYAALAARLSVPPWDSLERVFRKMMTPRQAHIALASPAPSTKIAADIGITPGEVDAEIQDMLARGLMIPTGKGPFFARALLQLHDMVLTANEKYIDTELIDRWEQLSVLDFDRHLINQMFNKERPSSRVVPHLKAVQDIPGLEPFDNIVEIVASAGRWTVIPCPCRRQTHKCGAPVNVCIQMDKAADFAITRGTGPALTKEEALAVIAKAEEAGLLHNVRNQRSAYPSVCNCCGDCCCLYRPLKEYIRPEERERAMAKSRFEAVVDSELCTGCQICVDRCPLDAIEMRRVAGSKRMKASIDPMLCYGCGSCVTGCLDNAVTMRLVRPPEYVPVGASIAPGL